MRKVSISDLETLRKKFEIIENDSLEEMIGGLDSNDCWWRCIAYINSGGDNYTADDAYLMAETYHCLTGQSFDPANYAFSGNGQDHKDCASQMLSGLSGRILCFDTSGIPGWEGNGTWHAVIVTGETGQNINIFDPQQGASSTISRTDFDDCYSERRAFVVMVK